MTLMQIQGSPRVTYVYIHHILCTNSTGTKESSGILKMRPVSGPRPSNPLRFQRHFEKYPRHGMYDILGLCGTYFGFSQSYESRALELAFQSPLQASQQGFCLARMDCCFPQLLVELLEGC